MSGSCFPVTLFNKRPCSGGSISLSDHYYFSKTNHFDPTVGQNPPYQTTCSMEHVFVLHASETPRFRRFRKEWLSPMILTIFFIPSSLGNTSCQWSFSISTRTLFHCWAVGGIWRISCLPGATMISGSISMIRTPSRKPQNNSLSFSDRSCHCQTFSHSACFSSNTTPPSNPTTGELW